MQSKRIPNTVHKKFTSTLFKACTQIRFESNYRANKKGVSLHVIHLTANLHVGKPDELLTALANA